MVVVVGVLLVLVDDMCVCVVVVCEFVDEIVVCGICVYGVNIGVGVLCDVIVLLV